MSAVSSKPALSREDAGEEGTANLVKQLERIVGEASEEAIFACGGEIPIRANQPGVGAVQSTLESTVASTSIALRWDAPEKKSSIQQAPRGSDSRIEAAEKELISEENIGAEPKAIRKLIFPVAADDEAKLETLVDDCLPATFGRGNEDVLDQEYRRAGKMDPEAFSMTFNPYDLGIVDTIAQMLLPSALSARDISQTSRGVRAELYKLNVYSAPSGRFKPHVDTPRSAHQFGSLVVCLPAPHQGGQLAVRHGGREVLFDWGSERSAENYASVHWAAFYSDCEHEVLDVTAGNRVTLTYNLYVSQGTGLLAGRVPSLDAVHLPLYEPMRNLLEDKNFKEEGGLMGFFCAHAYPHTNTNHSTFPEMLKGVDMAIWETLAKLSIPATIQSVVLPDHNDMENWVEELRCMGREPTEFPAWEGDRLPVAWLSRRLALNRGGQEDDEFAFYKHWAKRGGGAAWKDIQWFTPVRGGKELQHAYTAYGNEASTAFTYSHCSIIAEVPPAEDSATTEEK